MHQDREWQPYGRARDIMRDIKRRRDRYTYSPNVMPELATKNLHEIFFQRACRRRMARRNAITLANEVSAELMAWSQSNELRGEIHQPAKVWPVLYWKGKRYFFGPNSVMTDTELEQNEAAGKLRRVVFTHVRPTVRPSTQMEMRRVSELSLIHI